MRLLVGVRFRWSCVEAAQFTMPCNFFDRQLGRYLRFAYSEKTCDSRVRYRMMHLPTMIGSGA